jgi:hypothetical protein
VFLIGGCGKGRSGPTLVTLENGQKVFELKGIVQMISPEKKSIILKPVNGDRVTLGYTEFTRLKFLTSFTEINREMAINVLYSADSGSNIAMMIEKIPKTG